MTDLHALSSTSGLLRARLTTRQIYRVSKGQSRDTHPNSTTNEPQCQVLMYFEPLVFLLLFTLLWTLRGWSSHGTGLGVCTTGGVGNLGGFNRVRGRGYYNLCMYLYL
jgi:hypothetical protein